MSLPLNVLIIEDSEDDMLLIVRELEKSGYQVKHKRVETKEDLENALKMDWDIIISDFTMPHFDGIEALAMVRHKDKNIPFLFVSGTIGEDRAVNAMKSGANDYILKGNLKRLPPAVERELREAKMRRARKESEERFRNAFDHAGIGMALLREDGKFLQVNQALCDILGYSQEELLAVKYQDFGFQEDAAQETQLLQNLISNTLSYFQIEKRYRNKNGKTIWAILNVSLLHGFEKEAPYYLYQIQDITNRKLAETQLRHLAGHDSLTGLANRSLLEESINQAISIAKKNSRKVAILFLDLDRFKIVNDTLGHEVGDIFLQQVSKRLSHHVRGKDIVARLGGDEFVIILSDVDHTDSVVKIARKILMVISEPFSLNDHEFYTSASIGISVYPNNGKDSQTLMKNADIAMYRAKNAGGNNYKFSSPEMFAQTNEKVELENLLRHALKENKFRLHYQPQVDLISGRIVGVEALIRLEKSDKSLILPSDFIPLAEETGLIIPIGEWVLREACEQNKKWEASGLSNFPICVSVNLSSQQFRQSRLVEMIRKILESSGLDPHHLELEITETAAMQDLEANIIGIQKLKDIGIKISIDDFGIGYSSLNYLKRFNIDNLKIDQSFIRNIPTDTNDMAITSAIISMAKTLGIKTVAEGVENEEQLAFLIKQGCDRIQGYYFSHPISGEAMTKMLKEDGNFKVMIDKAYT